MLLAVADRAQAQEGTLKVAVLRATSADADAEQANAIDSALLRDLAGIAGIESPTVSPVEYSEIQLTVGCQEESRACLAQIAQTIAVDAIVVRRLHREGTDGAHLELVYFDASSSDEPPRVSVSKQGASQNTELLNAVPSLVRQLFGIPETASAAEATPEDKPATKPVEASAVAERDEKQGGVQPLTWVALVGGAAVLTAGVIVGVSASSKFDEFKDTTIRNRSDATKADEAFDSAESRGLIASVLMPVGMVGLGVGVTLLVIDLSEDDDADGGEHAELSVVPRRNGGMLTMRGSF